jgi:transposase
MANFIKGIDRNQIALFPLMVDDMISEDNIVRVIDKFVEELPLEKLDFKNAVPNSKGTNHYDAKDLLKLYLYSYKEGVRSSRKIAVLCKKNIEVIWLLSGLQPDFRTISDFRKNHVNVLKKVFKELMMFCKEEEIIGNKITQDGVKLQAVNSKDNNYTLNKVDDRIKKIEQHIEKYLKEIDEIDKEEDKIENDTLEGKAEFEEVSSKLAKEKLELQAVLKEKEDAKDQLETIRKIMEENKVSQISLTDKDSRLMKNNGNFNVCYNNQVQVDVGSHLVVNFNADSNPADVGTIDDVTEELKKMLGMEDEVVTNITDQGYKDRKDMSNCLENGIVPEVTLGKEEENFEVTFPYEENEITEEMKKSTKKEDIKKCLRAGVIPEVYEEYLSDIKVEEKTIFETIEEVEENTEGMSETDMKNFAMENNCFIRDIKTDKVFCPLGETLRKKNKLDGDRVKYCNKMACKGCKNPCTMAKFKEIVMSKNQVICTQDRELRKKMNPKQRKKRKKIMLITAVLTPKEEDTKIRMQTGEHAHGTMKRADGAGYFLMRGKEKVNGELAIYYTASNIRRLVNMIGTQELLVRMDGLGEKITNRISATA